MEETSKKKREGAARNGSAPSSVSGPACEYIPKIPVSPNVDFNFLLDDYQAPSGSSVDIELKCDIKFQEIEVSGDVVISDGDTDANIYHFQQTWIVGGRSTLEEIPLESNITAYPIVRDTIHGFIIESESEIDVLLDIRGSNVLSMSLSGELGHYPNVDINGHFNRHLEDQFITSKGEAATLSFINGESTLDGQTIVGELEGEEYPALSGESTFPPIGLESGTIEVLSSITGKLTTDIPILSGKIDVLYNVVGNNTLDPIRSSSGEIELLIQIAPSELKSDITSKGIIEFVGDVEIVGNIKTKELVVVGRANQLGTIDGRISFDIGSKGSVEVRWFGMVEQGLGTIPPISSKSELEFYPEVKFSDDTLSFSRNIISTSRLDHYPERRVSGSWSERISVSSNIQLINPVVGRLHINGVGTLEGLLDHTKPDGYVDVRYIQGNILPFKDKIISEGRISSVEAISGNWHIGEIESTSLSLSSYWVAPSDMQMGDIAHLQGRVVYGDDDDVVIEQIYEVSNDRSMVVAECVPNPRHAVRLNTTDFNITGEELRRGTATFHFKFDHDIRDIKQINVWLRTPNGGQKIDTMRWNDRRFNNKAPHILHEPFRYNTAQLTVPVHCISEKENQFFIEIEYLDHDSNEVLSRSRTFKERLSYIIPFQAHFDNRNPYVNIADHSKISISGSKVGHCDIVSDEPKVIALSFTDKFEGAILSTKVPSFETVSHVPFINSVVYEDRILLSLKSGITYMETESVDLYNINIGG